MSPEKRADHITTDNLNHSGDLDGAMQELPREGAPSVQELNTGELEQIAAPDTSEALILHDDERPEFQERLAALRESHASAETATEAGGYIPTSELPVAAEQKKGHGKLYAVIGAAGAAAVTAASLFLLPKGENNDKASVPAPTQPVATAEATPGHTTPAPAETAQTNEQKLAALELSAENYKDLESLATALFGNGWTKWENEEATKANYDLYMKPDTNKTAEQLGAEKAAESASLFPSAFFVKNYQDVPSLVKYAKAQEGMVALTAARSFVTQEDPAPYKRTTELTDAKVLSGSLESGKVTFRVEWTDTSNAVSNKIGRLDQSDTQPFKFINTVTAVVENGNWKVADIQ